MTTDHTIQRIPAEEVERVMATQQWAAEERARITAAYHRGEMDSDEATAAMELATWPKWSISTLGPCPDGCRIQHDPDGAEFDIVSHEVVVAEVPTLNSRSAGVWYGFCDDLIEGVRGPAQVGTTSAEGLTPENARLLAAAVVEAARLAEGWNAGRVST